MEPVMPVLSLWPEWIWAIACLGKRVENRTWVKTELYKKRLLLHGSRMIGGRKAGGMEDIRDVLEQGELSGQRAREGLRWAESARGKIMAVVRVKEFVRTRPEDPWFVGPWGWVFEEVQVLAEPVEARGMQGIWYAHGDALERIRRQIG